MPRFSAFLLCSAALFAAAPAAHAGAVYQEATFGPSETRFADHNLKFQPFDTSLGTLTSVQFNINVESASYSGKVTNNASTPFDGIESISTVITIGSRGKTPAALAGLRFETPAVDLVIANVPAGHTEMFGPRSGDSSNMTFFIASSDLPEFEDGSFALTVIGTADPSLTTGGTISVTNTIVASGLLSLEYDYTPFAAPTAPVPEPGSLAIFGASLLGAGLLGTALARRRQD